MQGRSGRPPCDLAHTRTKDLQEAQANHTAAQNDLRSAEIALQAVRNRLRLMGKNDEETANNDAGTVEIIIYPPGAVARKMAMLHIDAGQTTWFRREPDFDF